MNAGTSPLVALIGVLCVAATAVPCLADIKDDFVNPPLEFRARPLWFWNNAEVTSSGVGDQLLGCRDRAGYGGLAPLPFGPNFTPELWDPHSGAVAVPEFTNAIENDQPVTRVKLTLGPVRSSFIIARR